MLGFEVSPVVQYVIAFAIIAALLGLFALVLRRIGGKRFSLPGQDRGRGRQPRLGIVDVYDLDRQRQLVLLRRDNVEHLVMLGGPNDLVVESNIVRVPVGRAPTAGEFAERLAPSEPNHEQVRPPMEPAIAASAGVALNGTAAREQAQREQAQREQAQREQAQREQAQREQARREQMQREAAIQQRPLAPPVAPQSPATRPVAAFQPSPAEPSPAEPSPAESSPAEPSPAEPSPTQPSPPQPLASPLARPASSVPAPEAAPRAPLKPVEPVVTAAPPPPPEPRRGLFGFGRAVEPAAPMPAFPSRPRATPVAPDFAPQRIPPKFAPAVEEKPAAPPADTADAIGNEQDGVEKSGEISAQGSAKGSAEKPAERSAIDGMPQAPEKSAASAGQPKPGRSLDDAILSDMTRQLEAALRRPGSATQPSPTPPASPRPPAMQSPSAPTLERPARASEPPAAPPADAPSEPKLYKPVATAAAAAATVAAVASVFRSSAAPAPSAPSNPVPPRPYGGADEVPPAITASKDEAIDEAEGREEPAEVAASGTLEAVSREDGYSTREQISGEQFLAADAPAEDAPVEESVEHSHEAATQLPTIAAAAPDETPSEIDQDDRLRDLPPETIEPVAVDAVDDSASSMQDEDRGEIADQAVPAAEAEDGVREVSDEPSEEAAKEASETGTEQRKEPTPVIDPFSVDEIEAEFARLLGRSVDKDPKNP